MVSTVNLHIYPSPITHESRMLKETKSIADNDLANRIYLIGMWNEGLDEHEPVDAKRQIWRVRAKIGSQKSGVILKSIRYIEWQARIFFSFLTGPVKIVNTHSLPVLPLGVLFKLCRQSKLIYDTHELETEGDGVVGVKRLLYKTVEKALIHFADIIITVNESIAQWYRNAYKLNNVYVVRNIPYRQDAEISQESVLKREFGLNKDETLFIFQGNLGRGRGIEMLLDVFSRVDRCKHIVFMGSGELMETVQGYVQMCPNIHLHAAVKPNEVQRYTCGADVGMCLQENVGLNYYLSLPNKFFEYIISGLPVIASDFPEMGRVIDEAGCGWKVPVDRDALFTLVVNLTPEDALAKRNRALRYREKIGWQNEERILLQAYGDLTNKRQT